MKSVWIRDTQPAEVLRAKQLERRARYLLDTGKREQYEREFGRKPGEVA